MRHARDFFDLFFDWLTKQVDYEIIHCPFHEQHDLKCKVDEERFFCYQCGATGTAKVLQTKIKTFKRTIDEFRAGKFTPL